MTQTCVAPRCREPAGGPWRSRRGGAVGAGVPQVPEPVSARTGRWPRHGPGGRHVAQRSHRKEFDAVPILFVPTRAGDVQRLSCPRSRSRSGGDRLGPPSSPAHHGSLRAPRRQDLVTLSPRAQSLCPRPPQDMSRASLLDKEPGRRPRASPSPSHLGSDEVVAMTGRPEAT